MASRGVVDMGDCHDLLAVSLFFSVGPAASGPSERTRARNVMTIPLLSADWWVCRIFSYDFPQKTFCSISIFFPYYFCILFRWVDLSVAGWIVSLVASGALVMILSILLAYYVYESGQANKNPRSVGKFRTGRLCRQLDSASDGPLEP